jgi:putative transposase
MPRRLRLEYPQAIHHVMARGNARQDIVHDEADRRKWVELLERTVTVHGWELFAFVLCWFSVKWRNRGREIR